MQKKHILIVALFSSFAAINAGSKKQTVDVVNDSEQALQITMNSADQSFHFTQAIPAYTRALIIAQLINLKSVQNLLLEAIVSDSVQGIQEAIRLGANVNQEIGGQRPLVFAVALGKINAVKCLILCGAA
jgi:DNA helicase HerA-like ATPase